MLVRLLSTVDNTRDYARVSHSRQWSNFNTLHTFRPIYENLYSPLMAENNTKN